MFDILSWLHRYIFIFLLAVFFIINIAIYFYNKKFLQPFLPVITIITAFSCFGLLSISSENIDYHGISTGVAFCLQYIVMRILLDRLLKINDILLFDLTNMLLAIGLIWLYRLNPEYAIKQTLFAVLGDTMYFFIFFLLKKVDLKKDYTIYLGLSILAALITTQVWGVEVYGSKNWLELLGYRFQPSEFLKIIFVIYISMVLSKGPNKKTLLISSASILVAVAFFALQRDLGSALIFFAVYLILLFVIDDKIYPTLASAAAALVMAAASYFLFGHIRSRVEAWLNPWKYVSDKSFQVTQSLFAIASGGLLGAGLNLGYPKYIPAVHTDFIFSAICEEVGILSGIIIILLLSMITLIGLNYSKNCNEIVNKLICLGLSSMTGIQTLVIIGGVLNIIPITGVTLPFVSYGGSSLLSQMINICLLYFVSMKETGDSHE
ncbi:FtsW/RodA/SpoVE family cell cycle protein [Lutispora thermophila]|uniref:Cell division protein FtsW, lipid II flippase n=1 Tax=Lutispora thermophila DSM 19022 TaxID=1122184 RepID=A0A1M6GL23_9FIRM|nr:FtsW/RodA/SpoVE family cell cycle protein [Lutispora thermophila]SHJ10615.1 cell division protein FtsW, lipid II flippase [Lutispora thermophila DSM 19022]